MGKLYRFPCGCEFPVLKEAASPDRLPLLDYDSDDIPDDCPAVWELLAKGLTKGVFQLESNLGRQWTKKLKPESIEHMGALGALLRPGPLCAVDSEGVSLTQHFVRRKNGEEPVEVFHPALEPILAKTFAVLTFQEQSMKIAQVLAGFGLVAVDRLRKGIGKKDQKLLASIKQEFLDGCKATGVVDDDSALTVWGWIAATGRYQFNKSHADSYGIRGYKTAYIKAHFPLAFFGSWTHNAGTKSDKQEEVLELVNDARLFGIPVHPPDIRQLETYVNVTTEGDEAVWFGLADIKGVGEIQVGKFIAALPAAERAVGKPLCEMSWLEVLTEVLDSVSSNVAIRFIEVGALRHLPEPRSRMRAEYDKWESLTDREKLWVKAALSKVAVPTAKLRLSVLAELLETTPLFDGERGEPDPALAAERDHLSLVVQLREQGTAPASLLGALKALSMPRKVARKRKKDIIPPGPYGGCATDKRESFVRSQANLLEFPPSPLVDTPHWLAWTEESLLGISLTCAKIDSCDISAVNCTCKEFMAGRTGYLVFGVEVQQVREVRTKKGKTPGSKMAFLTLGDGSCALSEVLCFPDVWKEFGHLLTENNTVIVQGEREAKSKDSTVLIIKKVWQANSAAE